MAQILSINSSKQSDVLDMFKAITQTNVVEMMQTAIINFGGGALPPPSLKRLFDYETYF